MSTTKFHVVRITSKGYRRLASFSDRSTARAQVLADPLRIGGCVLRDGNTGQRFSPAELHAELVQARAAHS